MASKLYEYIINTQKDDIEVNNRLYELSASFLMGTIDFDSDDLENDVLKGCTIIARMIIDGVQTINNGINNVYVTPHKVNRWEDKK